MTATGTHLVDNPFWYFVMENAPNALYQGYRSTLYGLVSQLAGALQSFVLPHAQRTY